ncbi:dienelactone hydrolase family protein [Bacillus paralicheniformis]|uniref:dienelactone hydrolase family protein n=1 Tax=Bacillus paralicheniformis TaxID=1648923 RepID=UPI0013EF1675|nr:dienelactone hydrolase family protein [Bacillus paralicheniformis]QII50487.1 dienelactone hydrolase family protein [Bacillus paralicheniformis]
MIHIQNKSDTAVIVLHEIYGINRHMHEVCRLIAEQGFDVICPNLLNRDQPFDYAEEKAAYLFFMENVGFPGVLRKINTIISKLDRQYLKIILLGFSVGATAAWLCSEDERVDGIAGYYGSRIRDYLNISPSCPALLFFPEKEQSFDVDECISQLESKKVKTVKLKGEHGFSDPYSVKYNRQSSQIAYEMMMEFLIAL